MMDEIGRDQMVRRAYSPSRSLMNQSLIALAPATVPARAQERRRGAVGDRDGTSARGLGRRSLWLV